MSDGIPDIEGHAIVETPDWAQCADCGGQVYFLVWGEGIDSSVGCADCDNKDIYR